MFKIFHTASVLWSSTLAPHGFSICVCWIFRYIWHTFHNVLYRSRWMFSLVFCFLCNGYFQLIVHFVEWNPLFKHAPYWSLVIEYWSCIGVFEVYYKCFTQKCRCRIIISLFGMLRNCLHRCKYFFRNVLIITSSEYLKLHANHIALYSLDNKTFN